MELVVAKLFSPGSLRYLPSLPSVISSSTLLQSGQYALCEAGASGEACIQDGAKQIHETSGETPGEIAAKSIKFQIGSGETGIRKAK